MSPSASRLEIRLFSTPDGVAQLTNPVRRPRVAVSQVDLRRVKVEFLRGIALPSHGIIRSGSRAFASVGGVEYDNPREMRTALEIRPAADLIAAATQAAGDWIFYVGCGNTVMNDFCLALDGRTGELIHKVGEGARLAAGASYSAVMFGEETVGIHDVQFLPRPGGWNVRAAGEVRTGVRWAVTGQRLVRGGRPVDPLESGLEARCWSDLRHLLRFGYTVVADESGVKFSVDFGLDRLARDAVLREQALTGEVVTIPLCDAAGGRAYTASVADVERALQGKGYAPQSSLAAVRDRGEYWIDQDRVSLRFLPAVYNHNILALGENDGPELLAITVGGFSNNIGVTLASAAEDLVRAGVTEAVVLDQGGDAFCQFADQPAPAIPSCEARLAWSGLLCFSGDRAGVAFRLSEPELDPATLTATASFEM